MRIAFPSFLSLCFVFPPPLQTASTARIRVAEVTVGRLLVEARQLLAEVTGLDEEDREVSRQRFVQGPSPSIASTDGVVRGLQA